MSQYKLLLTHFIKDLLKDRCKSNPSKFKLLPKQVKIKANRHLTPRHVPVRLKLKYRNALQLTGTM